MTIFVGFSMPLLFVVSGAAVRFALRTHTAGRFVRDRALRLLVPLAVGAFTHVAYQVYLQRKSRLQFQGSFFEFLPGYFDGWYGFGEGNFAWMGLHLWYLELLFVLSLAFLPLLLWFRSDRGARALSGFCSLLARRGGLYLLALPVALALVLPPSTNPFGGRWWGGWNIPAHACFFLSGYLLASSEALYDRVRRRWWLSGLLSAAVTIPVLLASPSGGEPAHLSLGAWVSLGGMAVASWFGVLAILGAGIEYLRPVCSPFLARANEAVLPFYVLHQSVILAVGWQLLGLGLPDLATWALTFAASLVLTVAACEWLVRPFAPIRFLFGMTTRPPKRT
jgi:peptidoglycan/LPS O-acetylase OafA/YrhL